MRHHEVVRKLTWWDHHFWRSISYNKDGVDFTVVTQRRYWHPKRLFPKKYRVMIRDWTLPRIINVPSIVIQEQFMETIFGCDSANEVVQAIRNTIARMEKT